MKLLPDNSIDLVVTSPPYDQIRDYKGFKIDLHGVGVEISRILKDGGICVMVIQDGTKDGRKSGTSFQTIVDWDLNTELDIFETCIYYRSGTPGRGGVKDIGLTMNISLYSSKANDHNISINRI